MSKKLSIIIPTLEEEKIIEKTLLALKELRDVDHEIIVSDGYSKDRTVEIARKHAHKVVVHDGKTRQTIGKGLNAGVAAAEGKYVVRLDGDVFIPDVNAFFQRAVSHFEKDDKLFALTTHLRTLPEHEKWSDRISWILVSHSHWFTNNILKRGTSSGEFQMFRADEFRRHGGYDEELVFGEDAQIFWRMSQMGKTLFDYKLQVMHTSRRAHNMKLGWLGLWHLWTINVISNVVRKKPVSKEWKVSR